MYRLLYSYFLLSISVAYSQQPKEKHTAIPLKEYSTRNNRRTNLVKYLDAVQWNELFPNRYSKGLKDSINNNPDFYSFQSFVKACNAFPGFLSAGDESMQKRELAAFLANIAQETSGGWPNAPGGYFKWGLYFLEEQNKKNNYADTANRNYAPVAGKHYYGRGPKQLSWNYNYGQFSEAWFGTKDSLLIHPEWLSRDPVLSFASAIWFWMTAQPPKPSCHDIMTGKWKPNKDDISNNRLPGFGATVNVINGGVECGIQKELEKTAYRYDYYKYFCNYFHVQPGENISCLSQKPFGSGSVQ
ncbi:MAG: chitinase [Bacteroidota bacterium]|nr:chitinase [Bacteroidota bacterium]